ncbi:hypothetical protein ACWEKT_23375 [Nocardia takedensis]
MTALLPIGRSLGRLDRDDRWLVQAGGREHTLDSREYRLWTWALTGGGPCEPSTGADSGPLVRSMIGRGLLLDFHETDRGHVFDTHTLAPEGSGHGNRHGAPDEFVLTDPAGRSTVVVSGATYFVWAHADPARSLSASCRAAAAHLGRTVTSVAAAFAADLASLLRSGCVTLDLFGGDDA